MDTVTSNLIKAEQVALELFNEVEKRNLIVAGKDEKTLNTEIFNVAKELFGIEKHWHKRIVRSGENTLHPYKENPPNKVIQEDDILFFDFGPIIDKWEADLGRTYVIGNNLLKLKLKNDIEKAWQETKTWFDTKTTLKASELFAFVVEKTAEYGWEFGGEIAGHLVGEFPHEKLEAGSVQLYIHPDNHNNMFDLDANGEKRHWILEMHFVDRVNKIGGFYEQLLT
ncbi:M24 family metallopeptidase [Tenacibaculum sp. M341]|uniref:M24 family metallopeptidase n=1 Tax=Tenacibaculum sp. M341 TaxID=2530339 RepID=UPI001044EE0A|nr:M24 family metallopeptidase [Tenacibaculum sp. M341]TCI90568.1 aminopeptidase P family protein [Tenacibaculum sp. M341]